MAGLLSKKKNMIGVDIGSSSLKLVEIQREPDGCKLAGCSMVPLERGAFERGLISDGGAVINAIKRLVEESGTSTKPAGTALSGFAVYINKIAIPDMSEEEIRRLILDEADEYLPGDLLENVYFDIHILGTNDHNREKIDVIIAAAKKEIVSKYQRVFESAGLRLVLMDVDVFALERAYEENYDFGDEDVIALVHVGADVTNLHIVRGDRSLFIRNILMGGNLVTEAIQSKRGVSFSEAERMKLDTRDHGDEVCKGVTPLSLAEPIIEEIERSMDFYVSSAGLICIKKALLSGGSAALPGLAYELSRRLRCDVELFNPFQSLKYDRGKFGEEYLNEMASFSSIAVGLALRRMEDL